LILFGIVVSVDVHRTEVAYPAMRDVIRNTV